MDGPLSFSSTCDPTCDPQTSLLEGMARSRARSCQQTVHSSFHCLVTVLLLGQNMRSRSTNLYLQHFPFCLVMTSSLGQSPRSRLPICISNIASFGRQSLLMILLFIVLSYSDLSTYGNLGTFLVRLAIVLSLRKALIGLVYKPVTILFPHHSILLFTHTCCLLTWRGRRHYTNTSYLFIHTLSSFCFFDLSLD